ncbi:MAG: SWIM zinc finger family protein [Eubacteriales bacterium]
MKNFEKFFGNAVLLRGKRYYTDGNIMSIEEEDENEYVAEVQGSEIYSVEVTLDTNGDILDTSCDCPYDMDTYCKHQAAVFYALRKLISDDENSDVTKQKNEKKQLTDILGSRTKEELIEIILLVAEGNRTLSKHLIFEYGSIKNEVESFIELMNDHINKLKRRGVVNYKDMVKLIEVIKKALAKADNHQDPMEAVRLYLASMSVFMELLDITDDSESMTNEVFVCTADGIRNIIKNGHNNISEKQRIELFDLIMHTISDKNISLWYNRYEIILRLCIPLCELQDCRIKFDLYLQKILDKLMDANQRDNNLLLKIKMLQLELIILYNRETEEDQFIEANIAYSDFRKLAIEKAIKDKDYKRVLKFAKDRGLDSGRSYNTWSKYAYDAYKALGDADNIRRLARLFILDNRFEFYEELKNSYTDDEWTNILPELLEDMECMQYLPDVYEHILCIENFQEKLMYFCDRYPEKIFSLYRNFDKCYNEQINRLFITVIQDHAKIASDRSNYKSICKEIRVYKKACGKAKAAVLKHELIDSYRRKPAFLDELKKIKD